MLQPAHDGLVLVQNLHAVDAEVEIVLAGVARSFGDDKRPSDQWRGFAGPASLNRKFSEIDLVPFPNNFLAGRAAR